jgi:hypothetical protein
MSQALSNIATFVRKIREEQGIHVRTSNRRTQYTVTQKIEILKMAKDSGNSLCRVATFLADVGMGDQWMGMLYRWNAQLEEGAFVLERAVAVSAPRKAPEGKTFKDMLKDSLASGHSEEAIMQAVRAIFAEIRSDKAEAVRSEVEALLAAQGLTLADLK